jgi:hypothetical protein
VEVLYRGTVPLDEHDQGRPVWFAATSSFHPDWSMLEATRSSLREHMAALHAARSQAEAMAGLLEEARKRLVLPPKCIAVGVGDWRDGSPPQTTARWPQPEPVAGESAGYETRNMAMGAASSVPSWYRWRPMVWQDNPDYAEAIDYRDRIDAALAAWKGKQG